MDKLKMYSPNLTEDNIARIEHLAYDAVKDKFDLDIFTA